MKRTVAENMNVLAFRLSTAMAWDRTVVVELRARPPRTVRGTVCRRWRHDRKIDQRAAMFGEASNVVFDVRQENGEVVEVPVEKVRGLKVLP